MCRLTARATRTDPLGKASGLEFVIFLVWPTNVAIDQTTRTVRTSQSFRSKRSQSWQRIFADRISIIARFSESRFRGLGPFSNAFREPPSFFQSLYAGESRQ